MDNIQEELRKYRNQIEDIIVNAERAKTHLNELLYMEIDYKKGRSSREDAINLMNEVAEFINH